MESPRGSQGTIMSGATLKLLVLKTGQVEELRTFYGMIGVPLLQEQHGGGPVHYAGQIGDAILEVYPLPNGAKAADATTRLGFTVDELAKTVAALKNAGAVVMRESRETEWGLCASIRDPDGRTIQLYQR
jgi:lactoylglutathione lyase